MIDRRTMLAGLICLPASGLAHDGHSGSALRIETIRAEAREGGEVGLLFLLQNQSDQMAGVTSIATDVGEIAANVPLSLQPGDTQMLQATLEVTGEVPGIFTVLFTFGDGESGPVLVILP